MELRCREFDVMSVEPIYARTTQDAFDLSLMAIDALTTTATRNYNFSGYTHTNEGLVIRLDKDGEVKLFKYKGREFLMQEGILPQQVDGDTND